MALGMSIGGERARYLRSELFVQHYRRLTETKNVSALLNDNASSDRLELDKGGIRL